MKDILGRVLKEKGLLDLDRQREIVSAWNDVAGTGLSGQTRVASFRGGTLTIEVISAALRQELSVFRREELLTVLRARYRSEFIEDLRFRLV